MIRCRKITAYALAMIVLFLLVTGCGAKMASEQATVSKSDVGLNFNENTVAFSEETQKAGEYFAKDEDGRMGSSAAPAAESDQARGMISTGYEGNNASLDILAQRKVIRNANLTLEVDNFYDSYGNLQAMLNGIGFVQESNIHRDYYHFEGERKSRITGNITLRINARYFDNILNDVKGLGDVIDDRIYSTDVTDAFFDTEGRLKILRIEYDYLEEYMRSLKDPDAIFKTRMRMTELQTEIERLTGTLNKWTDLVELSTITIQMTEKYPEEMTSTYTDTYWDRVKQSVNNSIYGVINALGNLLIFIIEAIPVLVILGLLFLIGRRLYRRIKRKKKKLPSAEKTEEERE